MPLEKLIKGFKTFRSHYFEKNDHYGKLIAQGQTPDTLVIACSDSRNDPALLTRSKPGDMFVVRNVAAIVPPYQPDNHYHGTSAAIEFAVKTLKVKDIIVLGHALCGGVQALADQGGKKAPGYEFLSSWIGIGGGARDMVDKILPDAPRTVKLQALEQAVILTSLNNLMTFPWIKESVESGKATLHGWYFDMLTGKLLGYNFGNGRFEEIGHRTEGFSKCSCDNAWSIERLFKAYV